MDKKIVIDIPFNIDLGSLYPQEPSIKRMYDRVFWRAQTKEWIDYRIDVFMKYTASSLIGQTDQSFICLMRYHEPSKELVFESLARHPKLPDNILFTSQAEEIIEGEMAHTEYLYHGRIDSDNMYHPDFIKKINQLSFKQGVECLLCQEGYIYDETTNRLGHIHHPSPSLYVYIYNKAAYQQKFKNRLFENHFKAVKLPHEIISGDNYMVIVHKENVDNQFNSILGRYQGRLITDEKIRQDILDEWGISSM